jgi:hypothetical protein
MAIVFVHVAMYNPLISVVSNPLTDRYLVMRIVSSLAFQSAQLQLGNKYS